jgi:hypothetical protein
VLTGAWLFPEDPPAHGVSIDLAALEWVALTPALRLDAVAEDGAWSLFDTAPGCACRFGRRPCGAGAER